MKHPSLYIRQILLEGDRDLRSLQRDRGAGNFDNNQRLIINNFRNYGIPNFEDDDARESLVGVFHVKHIDPYFDRLKKIIYQFPLYRRPISGFQLYPAIQRTNINFRADYDVALQIKKVATRLFKEAERDMKRTLVYEYIRDIAHNQRDPNSANARRWLNMWYDVEVELVEGIRTLPITSMRGWKYIEREQRCWLVIKLLPDPNSPD